MVASKKAMDSNLLRRPTENEILSWENNPNIKLGKFLIVSPYVFLELEDDC